jgi:hypothetical protein
MMTPVEIRFHNTPPLEDAETGIRHELAALEKDCHDIVSCHVDVEVPEHPRHGSVSRIRLDLGFRGVTARAAAGGPEREIVEHHEVRAEHKDVLLAIHEAFKTARRRLKEFTGGPSLCH